MSQLQVQQRLQTLRGRMRIRGDLPGDPVVTSGKMHKVEVVNKYGNVMTQALQGEQIQWRITYSITSSPVATMALIFEVANPDAPGTHTGLNTTGYGDGRIMTKTTAGILMPNHDIRYYVTMWDHNWKLLGESPMQTLRYMPPPPPIEPTQPPTDVYPPVDDGVPPPYTAPPPPIWQPLRYLIWKLTGQ